MRQRLERLKAQTEADSLTEVIRRALAVYELLLEQKQAGWETIVRRDDSERSVLIPEGRSSVNVATSIESSKDPPQPRSLEVGAGVP